ncbi:hydroxypyruvate isomerase family protein [Roseospira visakhapatnamensis]|uniref:Hydroxypyruvate isomerase n=1 Tax=Roseospira visakhapatnamensis TaxID=390880 RepID=A0A7W6RA34_9PROT|nr:TIM barrel protein [Roseospira visakhapatnamensis]MBB4264683.1 hydroxypyruvate isomerase [Roseospira visakhapatnamensis]
MPTFSANLGFLWRELPLPDAIRAAGRAGFRAVECHVPYEADPRAVTQALADTGLPMLGLNTRLGANGADDFGLMSLAGREREARDAIDEAIAYAVAIGCRAVNCVAGKSHGAAGAQAVYEANLAHACARAAPHGLTILIEPINQRDAPGYHLRTVEAGIETIQAVGAPNLKLMLDCYHTQITQGDLTARLKAALPVLGHVQIAAVPDRGEPDRGEVHYPNLLAALDAMGWDGYVGAEYHPRATTEAGLGWLAAYRS